MNNVMKNIIMAIIFVVAVVFVFIGQKNVGYTGLMVELAGLIGIIGVLYAYNKRFK